MGTKKEKQFTFPVKDSDFKKSSYSHPGGLIATCVKVAKTDKGVAVRDSKNESNDTLYFKHEEWQAFIKGVKEGQFD
jgi:hypothetical protein